MAPGKTEGDVVAGFSESDRRVYVEARKNPTVEIHVALLAVAEGYQRRGQHQEAARVLRRVVEIFPNFSGAWTELAGELSRYSPAEGDLAMKRALELDPNARITLRNDALPDTSRQIEQLLNEGNLGAANKLVDDFAAGAADTDWAFLRMAARVKLQAGDPAAAVAFAERALKVYPRDSETKVVLGTALTRNGQAARGEKLLTEMSNLFSKQPNFLIAWAESRLLAGKLEPAEASIRRAIDLAPEMADAHALLGRILMQQKRYAAAIVALREVLKIRPFSAEYWDELSIAYLQIEKFEEAKAAAEKAWALSPTTARFGLNLGTVFLKTKEWAKAAAVYERIVSLDSNDANSWNNLGYALLQLGRPGDAVAPLDRAVLINPNLRAGWLNLAQAARLTGRGTKAKIAAEKAKSLPTDPNETSPRPN